ncbi:IPT/TIG domain-containing protein [Actinoplanes sp. NPDC051861]|uniref:phage tail tube protein n=1 Tax=Actinoplanes sp. NPDC051861 TaxID=3155170 RepID=UPI003415A97F
MATTPPTRVTQLARTHRLDINTVADPGTGYAQLFAIEEMKYIEERRTEDDEAYEDGGWARDAVLGGSWRLEIKLDLSTNLAKTALDTVHAFLLTKFKATRSASAQASEFGIRFYNRDGLDDGQSYEGRVYVKEWKGSGGKGRETPDLVLQGQGAIVDITNPLASALPVITSLSPAAAGTAAGGLIQIFGQKFTGATQVSFGGTNATNFTVISDVLIVATKPALTAGTKDTVVTTGAGSSANTAADDLVIS